MKRLILAILLGLAWTNSLNGQIQIEVQKALEKKDFATFKKYADNLSSKDDRINCHWEYLRDLTNNFQEGVFIFEKSVPNNDDPAISSVYTFRINLIITKTTIAYYDLSEEKNKKVGQDWEPYYESIDRYKDDKAFENLKASFKNIFQSNLNENELFITDFVYGLHCGFAGVKPAGRQQIDEWIKSKNKTEILTWLKSTNTEKQLYAINGLYQLKELGISLTDGELKMIKYIRSKKGTICICSGCMHSKQDIISTIKNFN